MKKRVFYISGFSLIIMGTLILINSIQSITGMAIFENVDVKIGTYSGIWLLLAGLVLLEMGKNRKD